MTLDFTIVDVFTDRPLAGNQLAVVLDAGGLDTVTMQAVAREFNFSETTFVSAATREGCDVRVRIFTPAQELPMAGHPTIGTAVVLHQEGAIGERATFELGIGPTPVEAGPAGAWMTQREAQFLAQQPDREALAAALRLQAGDIAGSPVAQVVSTGNQFLIVPLASVEAVKRAAPDFGTWSAVSDVTDSGGLYCFFMGPAGAAKARMFIPALPSEDPATGSAAGPLGAYARRYLGQNALLIEQGAEIGRPSKIEVDASGPQPRVGGSAVVVARGRLHLG